MCFLVELYASEGARAQTAARVHASRGVTILRSIYLPEDETCLILVEGASEAVVRATLERAGVRVDRIVRAFEAGGPAS